MEHEEEDNRPPCKWEHAEEGDDFSEDCPACHGDTPACGWQWGWGRCDHPACAISEEEIQAMKDWVANN